VGTYRTLFEAPPPELRRALERVNELYRSNQLLLNTGLVEFADDGVKLTFKFGS
jgi:hypothetical protein